uniref:PNPLA domain-containing protein n=1 Tax=Acrobeloides nanus TaxID=290746 RepID=A0A914E405_9BILA
MLLVKEKMNEELVRAVQQRNIKELVRLYTLDVPGDTADDNGNNILHLAAKTNNANIVKGVLLLFERRYHLSKKKNMKGNLPQDESFLPQIVDAIKLFNSNCSPVKKEDDVVLDFEARINLKNTNFQRFERDHGHRKRSILLSLDGGGIRGLVLVQMLMFLEENLKSYIWKRFQWVSGTSTGAILALALAKGESPTKTVGEGRAHAILKAVSKKGACVSSMLTVGFRQLTEADGQPVDRAQAWCWSMNVPFFRFSPQLQQRIEIDEHQDAILLDMLWTTEVYMRTEIIEVEQVGVL